MILSETLNKERMALEVILIKKDTYRIVPGSLFILPPETRMIQIPASWKIVDEDNNIIPPIGYFCITAETINPYHLITDIF